MWEIPQSLINAMYNNGWSNPEYWYEITEYDLYNMRIFFFFFELLLSYLILNCLNFFVF